MKKILISALSLLLCTVAFSFVVASPKADSKTDILKSDTAVVTVANKKSSAVSTEKLLESRLLNMLNHNFVYGTDFHYAEDIVNRSVVALLNLRDKNNSSYIAQSYVSDFIFNMYGLENIDYSAINSDFPELDGFVFIIPKGYSTYTHEILEVTKNEDGSLSVKTKVQINSHDSKPIYKECVSLYVENTSSQFGYNIISSEISSDDLAA